MKDTEQYKGPGAVDVLSQFGIDTFVAGGVTRTSRQGPSRALVRSCWTLDYTLYAGARCRMGSADAPWSDRGAYVAHLYGPNVPYWEDMRAIELPGSSLWICFGGDDLWGLERLFSPGKSYAVFSDPQRHLYEPLQQTTSNWNTRYLADTGRGWRVLSLFFGIIDVLQSARRVGDNTFTLISPDAAGTTSFSDRVDRLLSRNLDRSLSLGELAKALDVSRSTLSHRFRAETCTTPLQRHTQLRMRKVTGMLAAGEPLKNIADQLGFCDVPHLSNVFRRQFGCSPREWLRGTAR